MGDKISSLFKSRRFWAAVAGVLAVSLQDTLGLDPDSTKQAVMLLAAWIIGDSLTPTISATKPSN